MVRRIGVDEAVFVADGTGTLVHGLVVDADRTGLVVRVDAIERVTPDQAPVTVVQALAKGDRAELAVETMTEVGVARIVPWQSARAIVKWQGERGEKSRAKWAATAREAAKQSRRALVPEVEPVVTGRQLIARLADARASVLILHEDAEQWLDQVDLPETGERLVIVGPEGGITDDELAAFVAAGGTPVRINDGVLRTSTAGAIAVAMLRASAR